MTAPVIHGMGRIMFRSFDMADVPIHMIRHLPTGPAMNADFIEEGARLLKENPGLDFPYIIVVHDFLEHCYWVIEGRHRLESYKIAGTRRLHVLVGRGMMILPN